MTDSERSMMAALRCVVAALSQPVQYTNTGDSVASILRGDARFAREVAEAEIRRMEREHPLTEAAHVAA